MSDSRMARLFGRFCSGSLGAKIKKPLRAPQPSGALISFVFGRGERIRTSGLLVPNQALYQAEPRPDGEQSKNTTSHALRYTKSSYRASTLSPPPFSLHRRSGHQAHPPRLLQISPHPVTARTVGLRARRSTHRIRHHSHGDAREPPGGNPAPSPPWQ